MCNYWQNIYGRTGKIATIISEYPNLCYAIGSYISVFPDPFTHQSFIWHNEIFETLRSQINHLRLRLLNDYFFVPRARKIQDIALKRLENTVSSAFMTIQRDKKKIKYPKNYQLIIIMDHKFICYIELSDILFLYLTLIFICLLENVICILFNNKMLRVK